MVPFSSLSCAQLKRLRQRETRLESNNMTREALMLLLNRQTKACCPN